MPFRPGRVPFHRDPATPGRGRSTTSSKRSPLPASILTQIDVWTNVEDNRTRLAVIALVTAGALLFRRRAPFVAPARRRRGRPRLHALDAVSPTTRTRCSCRSCSSCVGGRLAARRRLAVTSLAAILGAGWTVFIRPRTSADGADLAQHPDHRHLRALGCRGQALGAGPRGGGAGAPNRGGGAPRRRGGAQPDHPRAARRARPLRQRDDRAGERRPPAADARAAARARGADDGRGDGPQALTEMRRLLGIMRTEEAAAPRARSPVSARCARWSSRCARPGCRSS